MLNIYKMKKIKIIVSIALLTFVVLSCKQTSHESTQDITKTDESIISDPLPSWNEGTTKENIVRFVETVTKEGSPGFVPVKDRIATFDNDGNLWSEQPAYFQLFFAIDRVKAMAEEHPEWNNEQPYKAILENDMNELMKQGEHGLLEIVMATHSGMSGEEFKEEVSAWLATAKHPRFNQPYNALIYQPMLELLEYLRANEFKTFIVSGGGVDFMRVWTEDAYGIPPYQVVGSTIKTEFDYNNGQALIRKVAKLDFIDDKDGKPVGINKFIGKRPIFASGNSDGDLQMLQYADANEYPSFMLYLHHTDSEREWAYDRDSHIGRLDKGLDEAKEKGWTVIDMKNDWKTIYPFQMNN